MKCINCNSIVNDNAKYCPNCGTQLAQTGEVITPDYSVIHIDERDDAMSLIVQAMPYAAAAEAHYAKALKCEESRNKMYDLIDYFKSNKSVFSIFHRGSGTAREFNTSEAARYAGSSPKAEKSLKRSNGINKGILLGIIVAAFVSIALGFLNINNGDLFGMFMMAGSALIWCLWFYGIFCYRRIKFSGYEKALKLAIEDANAKAGKHIDDASAEVYRYVDDDGELPAKYINELSLNYMYDLLDLGRAHTLPEAMNMFEEYYAQQEMLKRKDEQYNDLLRQMQEFEAQYRKDQRRNAIDDALIIFSLLAR